MITHRMTLVSFPPQDVRAAARLVLLKVT